MSKTASGCGRFSRWRLEYSPVLGDLKSGIPAEVDMPAPVITTIRFARPSWIYSAMPLTSRDERVLGGSFGSICDCSLPIFLLRLSYRAALACWWRSLWRRPMMAVFVVLPLFV